MDNPAPVFNSPPFRLLPDSAGPRWYANVDNRLEISTDHGSYHVAVAVPAELFTLMLQVFKIAPEQDVSLAIDQEGERYIFSLMFAGEELRDLWSYSRGSLPAWILSEEYRL